MKSKAFALIALLFAVVFLVSSAVAVETSRDDQEEDKNQNQVGSQKQYGCRHGCCRYAGYRCVYCCQNAEEASLSQNQYKPQPAAQESNPVNDEKYGGWGGGGHGGGWGGGGHGGGWGGGGRGGGWGRGGRGGGRCCGKEKESNQAKP